MSAFGGNPDLPSGFTVNPRLDPTPSQGMLARVKDAYGGWPGPEAARGTPAEDDLTDQKVRRGPPGVIIPQFAPYIDEFTSGTGETPAIARAYRFMLASPHVKCALLNKLLPVAALDLKIHPADKRNQHDQLVADFTRWTLVDMLGGPPKLVEAILLPGLVDRYSLCEKVFGAPREKGRFAGKIPLIDIASIDVGNDVVPEQDDRRRIVSYLGLRYNAGEHFDPSLFVHWSHMPMYGNLGMSDLRGAYKYWWICDTADKLRLIMLQTQATGFFKGKYATESQRPALVATLKMAKELGWVVMPPGVEIAVERLAGASDDVFKSAMSDAVHAIHVCISGATLQSLEGEVPDGPGDSQVHKSTSQLRPWALARAIETILNGDGRQSGVIQDIVDPNYIVGEYPRATLSAVDLAQAQQKLVFYTGVKALGLPISKSKAAEDLDVELADPNEPDDLLTPTPPPGGPGMGGPGGPTVPPPGGGEAEDADAFAEEWESFDDWSFFQGPRGGKGWKSSKTGEVVYGDRPGRDPSDGAKPHGDKPARSVGDLRQMVRSGKGRNAQWKAWKRTASAVGSAVHDAAKAALGPAYGWPAATAAAAKRVGVAAWDKLPAPARNGLARGFRLLAAVDHAVEHYTHGAAQAMVAEVAKQRGLNLRQQNRVARVTQVADAIAKWTVNIPGVEHGLESAAVLTGVPALLAAKVGYYIPVASAAYLGYSTCRDPMATLRAARNVLSAWGSAAHKHYERFAEGMAYGRDAVEALCDGLSHAQDEDWYLALVSAALDRTHDLGRAVAAADHAVAAHPEASGGATEQYAEQDDNRDPEEAAALMAEILYGLFGASALKFIRKDADPEAFAEWDAIAHPRGKGGRFIPRGSAEAVGTAKEVIGKVLKGEKTSHSAEAVAQHLNILTVKQLKDLHEQHGQDIPGVLRRQLVDAVKERIKPKPATAPWHEGEPEPGKVYNAPTHALHVDPGRFQYKIDVDPTTGAGEELKAIKTFNPDFAGVVSAWKDPADGKSYVVNGHHRYELASRTGHPELAVRYVKAKTAKEARATGALINIAEGRGTAVDAAKFMRDSGVAPDEMEAHGVSLKGKVAADAATLTSLNDRLFDRVARGVLDPQKAVNVARHLQDHDLQDQLFRLLDKREEQGKDLSPRVVEEMAREMASTPKTTVSAQTLFGNIEDEKSLFVERNLLKAHVRAELSKEVNDFLAVASKRRAGKVSSAGNVLDVDKNRQIAEEADRVRNVFDTLVNRRGDVSDAVNAAAEAYAQAKSKKERDHAQQQAVQAVKSAVFREAGIGSDAGAEGGGVRGGGGANPPQSGTPTDAPAGIAGRGGDEPDGLNSADPFESFRKPGPAQGALFGAGPADVKPAVYERDAALRDLSAVRKRDSVAWDMPQEERAYGGAYVTHLPTGKRIESTAMGDEYVVKDRDGKRLGKFPSAKAAAAFVDGRSDFSDDDSDDAESSVAFIERFDEEFESLHKRSKGGQFAHTGDHGAPAPKPGERVPDDARGRVLEGRRLARDIQDQIAKARPGFLRRELESRLATVHSFIQRHEALGGADPQEPAAPQPPADHTRHVVDAVKKHATHGLASLIPVRKHLAQQGVTDLKEQDAAIQGARRAGLVTGSGLEGRHGVTPEEHAASHGAGADRIGFLALRHDAPEPPTAKPASPPPAPPARTTPPETPDPTEQRHRAALNQALETLKRHPHDEGYLDDVQQAQANLNAHLHQKATGAKPVERPSEAAIAKADPAAAVASIVKIHGHKHNLVSLVSVREALASVNIRGRAEQDAAIQSARKAGLVTGSKWEGRHGITPEERAATHGTGDDEIGFLSTRRDAPEPQPAKSLSTSPAAAPAPQSAPPPKPKPAAPEPLPPAPPLHGSPAMVRDAGPIRVRLLREAGEAAHKAVADLKAKGQEDTAKQVMESFHRLWMNRYAGHWLDNRSKSGLDLLREAWKEKWHGFAEWWEEN